MDIDELRARLRAAQVTGTSDEQPEQARRRQMAIEVTDEILTLVLTDPVVEAGMEAGKEALRAVNARAEAAAKREAGQADALRAVTRRHGTGGPTRPRPLQAAGAAATSKLFLVALMWCRPWLLDPGAASPLPRIPEIARSALEVTGAHHELERFDADQEFRDGFRRG